MALLCNNIKVAVMSGECEGDSAIIQPLESLKILLHFCMSKEFKRESPFSKIKINVLATVEPSFSPS